MLRGVVGVLVLLCGSSLAVLLASLFTRLIVLGSLLLVVIAWLLACLIVWLLIAVVLIGLLVLVAWLLCDGHSMPMLIGQPVASTVVTVVLTHLVAVSWCSLLRFVVFI